MIFTNYALVKVRNDGAVRADATGCDDADAASLRPLSLPSVPPSVPLSLSVNRVTFDVRES